MDIVVECYEPAIIDRSHMHSHRKFAIAEIDGKPAFIMKSESGIWVLYVIIDGLVCPMIEGSGLTVLPQPPNL